MTHVTVFIVEVLRRGTYSTGVVYRVNYSFES